MIHRAIVRPILFRLDPERAHHLAMAGVRAVAHAPAAGRLVERRLGTDDPRLAQELWGLRFPNPVGLAAGFDKQAAAVPAWANFGFGFCEVGTITAEAQPGNPTPRIFRLREDRALINRLGFNSLGSDWVAARLAGWERTGRAHRVPLGVNIGKTKTAEDAAGDYVTTLRRVAPFADYIAVNVSSPNTPGLRDLQERDALEDLLRRVTGANRTSDTPRPVLVKIAPDLDRAALEAIVGIAREFVDGLIVSNTTVSRPELRSPQKGETGGLSGAPLRTLADDVLRQVATLAPGFPLIGVGGIFTAEDAWKKLLAGASLVQLYTGFVYEGAGLPQRINRDLLSLLEAAGAKSIADVVGSG